ncbi:DUF1768 domain-containing protein [Synechococcales cyanobacterium C]|uniref:DUF1768 domain-containing protein n=1 Tax=Petrachloros mirabilis ULC683 TaxID=2781853 RepID=A0A8K2AGW8_9CYAN|nr:NADAR family protein [Petrachloros mirabilis]NCJ05599.1 DUF1768 domain-containing protein [Petrachloros mirabilis ULC683]
MFAIEKVWPTSEHYFQAQKHVGSPLEEDIRRAVGPRAAFKLGRSQQPRSDWAKVKDTVMYRAVRAKFEQNRKLREMLLSTGDAELIEHTVNDDYWGDGSGRNMLGCILMLIREEMRDSGTELGDESDRGCTVMMSWRVPLFAFFLTEITSYDPLRPDFSD